MAGPPQARPNILSDKRRDTFGGLSFATVYSNKKNGTRQAFIFGVGDMRFFGAHIVDFMIFMFKVSAYAAGVLFFGNQMRFWHNNRFRDSIYSISGAADRQPSP